MVLVDIDDSIIEVRGHAKQGAAFGYPRVRGLNMLLATASTKSSTPVVVAQRLVADALKTVRSLRIGEASGTVLFRAGPTPSTAEQIAADAFDERRDCRSSIDADAEVAF